jgi:nicotinamidase-related amidase/type 1 glutamine amidotransferase
MKSHGVSGWPLVLAAVCFLAAGSGRAAAPARFTLHTRQRLQSAPSSGEWRVVEKAVEWDAAKTAVVICDMWDRHWCQGATRRVAEMAPRMNAVVAAARDRGALIIHCPSDTMKFYADTPGRKLAQSAPPARPKVPLQGWCGLDGNRETALPIDDADGGCDDLPQCPQRSAWTRQIETIEIKPGDAITDSAEAYSLMEQRGIENVIVMGVHLNMCVLGRPFAIRQMVKQGKNVLLVRDLTDTMYNSRKRPYVPHCVGTDLMLEHVEKYWCPTITSVDFLGDEPFRFGEDKRPLVVFMIGEEEYRTGESLPAFATEELVWRGIRCQFAHVSAADKNDFPGLEALRDADLLFVSVRRRTPSKAQMTLIRQHLTAGKPVVGIRTASHAFGAKPADAGHEGWDTFDVDVLGGHYEGHFGKGPVTLVKTGPKAEGNPVLTGLPAEGFRSPSTLYRNRQLAATVTPLLIGQLEGEAQSEPVAWLNTNRSSRVFYTSLGSPEDFKTSAFRRLLLNGVLWALDRPIPPEPRLAATSAQ